MLYSTDHGKGNGEPLSAKGKPIQFICFPSTDITVNGLTVKLLMD